MAVLVSNLAAACHGRRHDAVSTANTTARRRGIDFQRYCRHNLRMIRHRLMPFNGSPSLPQVMVSARRRGPVLDLAFYLSSTDGLRWSEPVPEPERRDGLWQSTCLECFIAPPGSDAYWEFNVTPAGDWNCYRFDAYRRGMRAEPALSTLPITGSGTSRAWQIPLDLLGLKTADLSICAVLQRDVGDKLHYALHHDPGSPDFHSPESRVWRV